jgi:RNA polymerase sigma-70 factor (ECF subfamily)
LTLRTLGGLTTEEIARAFLVPEQTMAKRLVRAKRKIKGRRHSIPRSAGAPLARSHCGGARRSFT